MKDFLDEATETVIRSADGALEANTTAEIPGRGPRPSGTAETPAVSPSRAQLIILAGAGAGKTFIFDQEVTIGRAAECAVQLSSEDVSRRHARIHHGGEGFLLEDLGSRNGTLVNGVPASSQVLKLGDKIRIGERTLLMLTQYDRLEEQLLKSQRMESIGQLAGGVAHDFNNIVGAVLANISYLRGLPPASTSETHVQECFADIELAARRASDLTKQLLSFAQRSPCESRPVDVSQLVGEVTKLLSRTFDPTIQVVTRIQRGLGVSGDAGQLHQVLMNLCLNARDAMGADGTLTLAAESCALTEEELTRLPFLMPGQYVLISVADTGEGMTPETLDRIFEPFFTTKVQGRGTGLGLATVYGIVKRHGGHILAESTVGTGSIFKVYLPADEAPAETGTGIQPTTLASKAGGVVLLVEDQDILRNSARRLLQGLGYEVISACDGKEAIDVYRASNRRVDLVLLDMVMPNMGGVETFHELRNLDADLRVVLTSAYTDLSSVRPLLAAGARGFLPKPYDADTLVQALTSALAPR